MDKTLKYFHTDNGTEFANAHFRSFLSKNGTSFEFSEAKLPQQNGRAECNNRNILRKARILLATSGLKPSWWPYAVRSATFTLNKIYCISIEDVPFSRFYGRNPTLKF